MDGEEGMMSAIGRSPAPYDVTVHKIREGYRRSQSKKCIIIGCCYKKIHSSYIFICSFISF